MFYRNPVTCSYLSIDLRTRGEILRCPAESDIALHTPLPPLEPEEVAALTEKLYSLSDSLAFWFGHCNFKTSWF